MREQDLAAVLFAQGVQSGLSMEQVIDELGAVNWPSFVDTDVFREALADAAETQLRRQLDEQLAMIRRKIDVARPVATAPTPTAPAARATSAASQRAAAQLSEPVAVAAPAPESNGQSSSAGPSAGPATAPCIPTPAPVAAKAEAVEVAPALEPAFDENDMPSDATMVWTTQHGERSEPE